MNWVELGGQDRWHGVPIKEGAQACKGRRPRPRKVSQEIRNLTAENASTEMYTQQEHAVCTMYTNCTLCRRGQMNSCTKYVQQPGKRRAARHVFIGPFYSVA